MDVRQNWNQSPQKLSFSLYRMYTSKNTIAEIKHYERMIRLVSVSVFTAGLFSALACEGYKLNLVCPGEEVLHINSLEYGRSDNDTCQHPSINMTDCVTSEPLEQVSNLCNGRPDCSIFIYNNLLGDPCPGTYKYLLLDHLCGSK